MSIPTMSARWLVALLALSGMSAQATTPINPTPYHALRDAPRQALLSPSARSAPPPQQWHHRPPSEFQARYRLPDRKVVIGLSKTPLVPPALTPACQDMTTMAGYTGAALADYLVSLPDSSCTHGLFTLSPTLMPQLYSAANQTAVAQRMVREANSYNASSRALVNLTLYLRAGYYLAAWGNMPAMDASVRSTLRPAIKQLLSGHQLFAANALESSSGAEVTRLISNMMDEAYYLNELKAVVLRYTNSASQPNAAQALRETSAAQAFTGVLTVFYYAHFRGDATPILAQDAGYSSTLYNFVVANKSSLIDTETAYQLGDATRESLRFLQYPTIAPIVKDQTKTLLASSSMTGNDNALWLAAAQAVKYYDAAHCADYGTCNFEALLANAVLQQKHACSPTIRIRAQQMNTEQMQSSCALLQKEEAYFHQMLQTKQLPVANDNNTSLEVVVFADYNNYSKYASVIFGISTDNGGIYEEGNPAASGNQSRFIAHEASWLRPTFSVWNLEHEYVHYLDGRFDMYGDFNLSTQQPTVWWIEGLAEYISRRNNHQPAIDAAKTATYSLSQIFNNSYAMSDYVPRAYSWGYMATRFMFEKHRADVDSILSLYRPGNYTGYRQLMEQIGTRYDSEFATWVQSATTEGQPPVPTQGQLPACREAAASYLGKNCSIGGLSSSSAAYATILLPENARNLKLWTLGGSGDVDLYLSLGRYPSATSYDLASVTVGNNESISIAAPQVRRWYYLTLKARQPFANVSINASYD